jgi:glycosyltransferase involved in cell wall biosynthesis
MRGRILVVDHKTPRPDEDSGSASAFSYLTILCRAGFDVTFAPFDLTDDGGYTKALNALGIKTLAAPEWTSIEAVLDAFAAPSDIVFLYRAPVAAALFDYTRRAAPTTKILFHAVDLHFMREQREAEIKQSQIQMNQAVALRAIELDLIARADAAIVVSAHELEMLRELVPAAAIHRIPILRETPNRSLESGLRSDVVFIGAYDHSPNVDGVKWFVREVWPVLQSKGFPHRFIIAGSHVPADVAALASDNIEVRGYVDDLALLFSTCRISVAPLRYGGGIKGKIVSSLSYGVPVVATSIAAEGMTLRHGENILIADAPDVIAAEIMRLYADDGLWQSIASSGYQAFQDNFSLESGKNAVLAILDGLVAARRDALARTYNDLVAEREKLARAQGAALQERDVARTERDALLASRSWRITAPMRKLLGLLHR